MGGSGTDRLQFGPFEVDLHTHELWKHGTRIKLIGQPFEVLAILLANPGELVTRDALRERLWPGDTFVDFNHGLNAAVNKLREALSDSAENPRYVETLPRRGYRFIATVSRGERSTAGPPPKPTPPTETTRLPQEPSPVPPFLRAVGETGNCGKSRKGMYLLGAACIAALFGILLSSIKLVDRVTTTAGARSNNSPMQRIRPLTNLSSETSEPAFSSDGNFVAFRVDGTKPREGGIFVKALASDEMTEITQNAADCCPSWSPDGQSIAFSRFEDKKYQIYMVPTTRSSSGRLTVGTEKKLNTGSVILRRGELAWSPDGTKLAFAGSTGVDLLSLTEGTIRQLTEPAPLSEDWGPSFSPDGKRVLFVRSQDTGFSEEIMTISVYGGEMTRVTSEHARIMGPPQWAFDGQSIIYACDRSSHPALWRVTLSGESPVEINDSGWYPAVSRHGYRLAYQRVTRSLNIWQMDVDTKQKGILIPSTSETDQGPGPQPSPDGTKIAYMSDRSGTMEIWMSDRDGGNPTQLTALGGTGTPRWSPDSRSIAFDAKGRSGSIAIYTVSLSEGVPKLLVGDTDENVCPSWSRDGQWVYFASSRTGEWQVWKIPAGGGTPAQVTTHGGHAPLASADGKYIYYAKASYANPEVWEVPVDGGVERSIYAGLRPATWASWAVVDQGIVFAGPSGVGRPLVSLLDITKHKLTTLGELDTAPFWLGATPDAKTVLFDQPGWQQAQIMLVENFR
jgi:Tol biopolymer transport system component/DNA-binding winged helix-turn-helix (wHTH) protein